MYQSIQRLISCVCVFTRLPKNANFEEQYINSQQKIESIKIRYRHVERLEFCSVKSIDQKLLDTAVY